jgi:hypothetical protein
MIWLEAEELVKINLANNPSTYNNMFEQGWRLPTFFELNEAVRTGDVKLENDGAYATSDSYIENNKIIYVCLTIQKKIPRKLLISVDSLYVYAKLCIDKIPVRIENKEQVSKKVVVPSEQTTKNLKCCGNCMYYSLSGYCCNPSKTVKFYQVYAKGICMDWEYDARNYLSYSEAGESRLNLHNQFKEQRIDKMTDFEREFFEYLLANKNKEDLF